MDNSTKKLLFDLKFSIERIETFLKNIPSFTEYDENELIQDAVERNLITIGEAVNKLLQLNPDIQLSQAKRIVSTRNKLTHGYDEIENLQIWAILKNHLPKLRNEVDGLMSM